MVFLALAAFLGALVPVGAPLWLPVAGVILAFGLRSPALLLVATALLTSTLATRSWAGLAGDRAGPVEGTATVVTDPERRGPATRAVLRIDGMRTVATGYGPAGAQLSRRHAGDVVALRGVLGRYGGPDERRAALHVGHRLTLHQLEMRRPGGPLWRSANAVRETIADGAASLGDERRALLTGLVYGDDRAQSPGTEVDFRLAGLTHLLAVSGQNVAYALTVLRPLIERASRRGRWVATIGALVLFATITRYEPSVLRATVMAGLAVSARLVGREASGGRLLALAVTLLLVVDPLLAETIAFRLSVAASAGIVWLQPRIVPGLRGPPWLRETAGVTIAAQLAVAPILVTTFGPVSVMSVPANVVAGPLAGALMGWGMTAGLVAGLVPRPVASVLHLPTWAMLAALEQVATQAAAMPLAPVGLAWILVAVAVAAGRSWWEPSRAGRTAAGVAVTALLVALVPSTPPGRHPVGFDSTVVVGERVVLRLGREGTGVDLVEDLHRLNIGRVHELVAARGSLAPILDVLAGRIRVDVVAGGEADP